MVKRAPFPVDTDELERRIEAAIDAADTDDIPNIVRIAQDEGIAYRAELQAKRDAQAEREIMKF